MFNKEKENLVCGGVSFVHKFVSEKIQINKNIESLWIFCEKCGETKRLS